MSKTTVAAALRQRRRLTREPGASPQDLIAHPLQSAEGALEFGDAFSIPNELLSNVNRAFSAGAHLGVMSPGALPRVNVNVAPLALQRDSYEACTCKAY